MSRYKHERRTADFNGALAVLARSFTCQECGSPDMVYVRTIRKLGPLPELLVCRCTACHSVDGRAQAGAA